MAAARGGEGGNRTANSASPMSAYGNEFTFTDEELKNAALSEAGILLGSRLNPTVGMLYDMQKKTNASPQLQGVLNAIQAPFKAGYQSPSVPSGLLDSAVKTASGSSSGFPEFDRLTTIPSYAENANSVMGLTVGSPYNNITNDFAPASSPVNGSAGMTFNGGLLGNPSNVSQQPNTDTFASGMLGAQLAAIKAGENIPSPLSPSMTGEGWVDIEPGVNVNSPEVQDLIRMAKAASAQTGQRLTITSGVAPRSAGSLQHPAGVAIDLRAYSPVTGEGLANYQSPETFAAYESVAKAMRAAQQAGFPEYNDTFRWGGYFSGTPETYGALDLMHFDVNNPKGLGMAGGSFETGLTPQMRETWGIDTPTAASPSGPIVVAAAPSPAPAPVQSVMAPGGMAFNSGLLAASQPQVASNTSTSAPAQAVMAPGGMSFNAGLLGQQILAGSQPQVVDNSSAPEAPPIVRPTGAPTRLASLLFDRGMNRSEERRRKRKSTNTDQMQSDAIGGLLA
jgi:hypothetical protein